jgi:hypothetical protein
MMWITSQIGAREHYAIPRVLHRVGKLEHLYTDFWASAPWRVLGKLTGKGSLATRFHPELATAPATAFNLQALKASRQHFANPYDGFLQVGEAFGRRVVKDLDANASTLAFSLSFRLLRLRHRIPGACSMDQGEGREDDRLPNGSLALRSRSREG